MTAAQKHLGIVVLLLSCAAAQNPTPLTVRKVTTSRQGSDLRIEITVSAPVKPEVDTAVNPNRILLDFPNTVCYSSTKNVTVHANGVRQVRTAQHSTSPYVTRVVLDLDEVRPYVVTAEGNSIILTVAGEEKHASHGAPVAATSGNILAGVFRKPHRDGTGPVIGDNSNDTAPPLPAPPPAVAGPEFQPPSSNSSAASLPPPPPAVAQPQTTAAAPSTSAPPGTLEQKQITVAPKPEATARVIPTSPTPSAPAVTKPAEKPVQIAAAPVPPPPAPAASAETTPAIAPAQPAPVPTPAPAESVAPKPEEKIAEVSTQPTPAAAATPGITPAPTEAVPVPETGSTAAESAEASPAPAEPGAAAPPATLIGRSDDPSLHTVFRVKYVADGVAYLEGGRTQGLSEGMKLLVVDANHAARQGESVNTSDPKVAAELEVSAVAETSAVTDIHNSKRPVKVGDLAYLSNGDAESLVEQRTLSPTRQYPAVISFSEGDALDEDTRQEVPRPPQPSVNRARGRIGFDSIETFSHSTGVTSSGVTSKDLGVVF